MKSFLKVEMALGKAVQTTTRRWYYTQVTTYKDNKYIYYDLPLKHHSDQFHNFQILLYRDIAWQAVEKKTCKLMLYTCIILKFILFIYF